MKFEGVYVPIITPFNDDLSMDFDAFGEVIDWQIEKGTHGIIVGGSTGEFFSLKKDERVTQVRFAAERIAGRLPLIAGVNDLLPERCYELAEAAKVAGVDALLIAAPPYSLPGQQELVAHCLRIDQVARLPIILYNYPARTGVCMEREFLDEISRCSNVCAIKESSGDIDRVHMLVSDFPQFQLCAGAEDQVLEFFAWGARSWVSVVANFFPAEAVRFYEVCVREGDFQTGRQIMLTFLPLMNCLEKGGKFLQSVKQACEIMDRPGGPVRPPLQAMNEGQRQEILHLVRTVKSGLDEILSGRH